MSATSEVGRGVTPPARPRPVSGPLQQFVEEAKERRRNLSRVRAFRRLTAGRIFGATFRKLDGSERSGVFRSDVKKKDGSTSKALATSGGVVVWEIGVGYRIILLDNLIGLRIRGREIKL